MTKIEYSFRSAIGEQKGGRARVRKTNRARVLLLADKGRTDEDIAEALESRAEGPREGSFGRFAFCRDDQGSPFGLHQSPAVEGKGLESPPPAGRR